MMIVESSPGIKHLYDTSRKEDEPPPAEQK